MGGAAGSGAIVFCDAAGVVTALDAQTGSILLSAQLGQPVRSCVVNVDAWRFEGPAPPEKPLLDQLAQALTTPDAQLTAMQEVLLDELAPMPDASATRVLLDLAMDARTSPVLVRDSRAALAKRSSGTSYMVDALRRHYDYLHDVLRGPPVGPIAEALSHTHEAGAASLLAAHLLDPEDSSDDLKQVGAALQILAGTAEAPALRQFFGMYRANADSDDIASAVVSVGRTLIALKDKVGAEEVRAAAASPMTLQAVRDGLSEPAPQ
jgi:outer membrane protein assembly factor BamB